MHYYEGGGRGVFVKGAGEEEGASEIVWAREEGCVGIFAVGRW